MRQHIEIFSCRYNLPMYFVEGTSHCGRRHVKCHICISHLVKLNIYFHEYLMRSWVDEEGKMICIHQLFFTLDTVNPRKYAHGFVVLCFVVVMQSFIMNSHEVFIHIHQGCFAGTGAIVRLPQCQWSKPDGYRKNSQCITTTKHSKAKNVCIFLGIYCTCKGIVQQILDETCYTNASLKWINND